MPDGRAFYVMKFVRGRTIDEAAASKPALLDRLALLDRVLETVAFAHAQGIVHRDLKPSNVLVGGFGEVFVMDWGAAQSDHVPEAEAVIVGHAGLHGARAGRAARWWTAGPMSTRWEPSCSTMLGSDRTSRADCHRRAGASGDTRTRAIRTSRPSPPTSIGSGTAWRRRRTASPSASACCVSTAATSCRSCWSWPTS